MASRGYGYANSYAATHQQPQPHSQPQQHAQPQQHHQPRHQQQQQQQQQQQLQNQIQKYYSSFSKPPPTRNANNPEYQQTSVHSNQFNSTFSTLSDRYSYNAQLGHNFPAYNQQSFDADLDYSPQSVSGQNRSQYQTHHLRTGSFPSNRPPTGYGQHQVPQQKQQQSQQHQTQSVKPHTPDPNPSVPRSSYNSADGAQYHRQRTISPQWPSVHPTSFERGRSEAGVKANPNDTTHQESSDQELSYAAQQSNYSGLTSTTVNPSAVYDDSHEYRRLEASRRAAEAERLADDARKAEEARKVEEARKAAADEEAKLQALAAAARERSAVVESPQVTAPAKAKKPRARSQRKSKDSATSKESDQIQAAAATLVQSANSSSNSEVDLEAQMREMFKKMREFNQRDPDLLSRLWQQERDAHLAKERATAQQQTPAQTEPQQTQLNASAPVSASTRIQTPSQRPGQAKSSSHVPPNSEEIATLYWPAEKKAKLAEAISDILKNATNSGNLSLTEIQDILELNLNYTSFCQKLESMNFSFERRLIAEAFLAAAPEFKRNTAGSQESTSKKAQHPMNGESTMKTKFKVQGPRSQMPRKNKEKATAEQPSAANNISLSTPIDPRLEGLDAVKQFVDATDPPGHPEKAQPPSQSKPTATKSAKERKSNKNQPRNSLPPAPLTKHDLARKRKFEDLIDLSQQPESSDDEANFGLAERRQTSPNAPQQLPTPATTAVGTSPPPVEPQKTQISPTAPSSPAVAPAMESGVQSAKVVKQPSEIKSTAPHINSQQPIRSQGALPGPPELPLDHPARRVTMIQPLDKYKAIRRSSYNPKTIARDVLIACGRHPDMRHLNAHLETLKAVLPMQVDNNSDLSTFRWDVADPGGPAPGSGAQLDPIEATFLAEADADDEDSDDDSVLGVESRVVAVRQAVGDSRELAVLGGGRVIDLHPKKKPGRTSRRIVPGVGTLARDAERPHSRPSEGSRSEGATSTTPLTYQQLRQKMEAEQRARGEPVAKSRGRPVGWRKWMQKSPGPSKAPAKKPSPEPTYPVYKCQWKDCGAELHNLATLRRHLAKLHCRTDSSGLYPCLWVDCGRVQTTTDAATSRTTSAFVSENYPSTEAWKAHVEKKHLEPIAWKLGDGPKGGLSDNYESEVSDSYMSDSQGRRVTPRVVVPSPETMSAAKPDQTRAEREAELEQQAEENRKRDIGPGLDRHGATLANAKRRQGFMDDEDIAEVVDEDD